MSLERFFFLPPTQRLNGLWEGGRVPFSKGPTRRRGMTGEQFVLEIKFREIEAQFLFIFEMIS